MSLETHVDSSASTDVSSSSSGQTVAEQVKFSMRGLPLLDGGATMSLLGNGQHMWAHAKVYSTGGENGLHSHAIEDHLFIVLSGKALFSFGDDSHYEASPFEGVFLRKGTRYKFRAEGGENLVLMRVGAAEVSMPFDLDDTYRVPKEILSARRAPDGSYADGAAKANGAHSEAVVVRAGAFFAE